MDKKAPPDCPILPMLPPSVQPQPQAQQTPPHRGNGIRYSPEINLGHIVQFIGLVGAVLMGYVTLKQDLAVQREQIRQNTEQILEVKATHREIQYEIRQNFREILEALRAHEIVNVPPETRRSTPYPKAPPYSPPSRNGGYPPFTLSEPQLPDVITKKEQAR